LDYRLSLFHNRDQASCIVLSVVVVTWGQGQRLHSDQSNSHAPACIETVQEYRRQGRVFKQQQPPLRPFYCSWDTTAAKSALPPAVCPAMPSWQHQLDDFRIWHCQCNDFIDHAAVLHKAAASCLLANQQQHGAVQ
jgi:hypothetical protein